MLGPAILVGAQGPKVSFVAFSIHGFCTMNS